VDYKVDAMPKTLKIEFYQDGITDPFFHSVRLSISTSPALFTTFDQVKDHYTSFKRTASAFDNPGTTQRGISSFGRGGPGRGGGDNGRRGRGGDTPRKLPTQEEIDACTHIKAKRYEPNEYKQFSAAEKAKHWQLMYPHKQARGVDRGRGNKPAYDRRKESSRDTKPSSVSETASKRKFDPHDSDNDDLFKAETEDDKSVVSNRNNKALTRSSPSGRQPKQEN
jgi:hypothetical protein